jgi:uncharacterized protein YaiL (DUF2058 family)
MVSLQEQFLKAGLVDKNKVKLANQDKNKQKKVERRTGTHSVDEARVAALETQRKNAERARELNAQRDAAATQKAIAAQIAQMVQKIAERDASLVVRVNKTSTEIDADDPYAAFQVPDDLMW